MEQIMDYNYKVKKKTVCITKYVGTNMSIIIPNTIEHLPVTCIGEGSFHNKDLRSVIIPYGVTTIRENAFRWNYLTSIHIPESVIYIGKYAFNRNCLEFVKIPDKIKSIEIDSFSNNKLTSVQLPNKLLFIKSYAFYSNKLQTIIIPKSVQSINETAFTTVLPSFGYVKICITANGCCRCPSCCEASCVNDGHSRRRVRSDGKIQATNRHRKRL